MSTKTHELEELIGTLPGFDPWRESEGYVFEPARAERVLQFFRLFLKHMKGKKWAGKPLLLEDWQKAIVANLFGWVGAPGTEEEGLRRFRESLVYVPRKNGKTTIVAGIPLWMLFADGEPGPEIYAAASDKNQAALLYDLAKAMVETEPQLRSRAKVYKALKTIELRDNPGSIFRCLSADADTKHGFNSHCVVVDELHAQPNRELVDVLETGMGSRDQPLMLYITTADFERVSICNEKLDYAHKVCEGIIDDPQFLPAIWEADKEDDWTDPEVWRKANPNLGVSVSLKYIERMCKKALAEPSFENTFRRLHCNIKTEQADRWLVMQHWDKCDESLELEEFEGERCWVGLDLSSRIDITAAVFAFRRSHAGNGEGDDDERIDVAAGEDLRAALSDKYHLFPFFWVPGETAAAREKKDRVPYSAWERAGLVKFTAGSSVDYEPVRRFLLEMRERFRIEAVAIDPWNSLHMVNLLMEDGLYVQEFGQGFPKMSSPSKFFEGLIEKQKLAHGGNKVLRWMASNVAKEEDNNGNIRPSKKHSGEKIDGIVASIMAVAVACRDVAGGVSFFSFNADEDDED